MGFAQSANLLQVCKKNKTSFLLARIALLRLKSGKKAIQPKCQKFVEYSFPVF
jgi:hypothetical protein